MTDRKTHLDTLAVACLIGCCFLWGLNQVAAKAALPEVPALQQAAIRPVGGCGRCRAGSCWSIGRRAGPSSQRLMRATRALVE